MADFTFAAPQVLKGRGGRLNAGSAVGFRIDVDGSSLSDLGLAFQGRLQETIDEQVQRVGLAYVAAARQIADNGKKRLRADIVDGGFFKGQALSKTWRGNAYPQHGGALDPAVQWFNKAGLLIDAFELGATIHTATAHYLAIPQGPAKAIVRRLNMGVRRGRTDSGFGRDSGGKYIDLGNPVERVAMALGVDMVPIINEATGRGVLIAKDSRRLTKRGLDAKNQNRGEATVLFVLVKQATLKKRMHGRAILADLAASFPADFAAAVVAQLPSENQ